MRHTLILSEWLSSKSVQVTYFGEDVEKRGTLNTLWGNGNFCSHDRNWYGGSSKNPKVELPHNSAFLLQCIFPGKKKEKQQHYSERYMYPHVHNRTIYNSQDIEANLALINRCMDKKRRGVFIYINILK